MKPERHALSIAHSGAGGGHRLAIRGELDHTTVPDLTEALRLVPFADGSTLTLDLAELGFCDSTGLSVLLSVHKRLANLGGRLTVSAIDANLLRVLTLTGLAHLFTPEEQLRARPREQPRDRA